VGKLVQRSDGLRLTREVGEVYDLVCAAKKQLQITHVCLGLMSVKGGKTQVDLHSSNGHEVIVTAQSREQKQQIRLRTSNQEFTKQAVADHLRAHHFSVRFR